MCVLLFFWPSTRLHLEYRYIHLFFLLVELWAFQSCLSKQEGLQAKIGKCVWPTVESPHISLWGRIEFLQHACECNVYFYCVYVHVCLCLCVCVCVHECICNRRPSVCLSKLVQLSQCPVSVNQDWTSGPVLSHHYASLLNTPSCQTTPVRPGSKHLAPVVLCAD